MTSYFFTNDSQPLRGFRAGFNSNGDLVNLNSDDDLGNLNSVELNIMPATQPTIFIQADGHFRSIITVNGQMRSI